MYSVLRYCSYEIKIVHIKEILFVLVNKYENVDRIL